MTNTENNLTLEEVRERIEYLESFLLESRINTLNNALDMRTEYLTVMTENMFHAQNASAIVRHCEAFGVQNIHTVEELCPFLPTLNIALGTDKCPPDCFIVFGKESYGLSETILKNNYHNCIRIPMRKETRSLNLATSVGIILFEALRQNNFPGLSDAGALTGRIEKD